MTASTNRPKNALVFIFITLLIDIMGMAIIIPVIPKLIEELIQGDVNAASRYGGWLLFTFALLQFMCAPILGGLSDRYGRRPVLLIALLGMGIDYLFQAWAPTITWLFVGRALAGVAGASFTTASAFIADVSTPEKRAQNFGLIGVAFGLGFIIGPVIGGLFASFGSRVPFIVSAGFAFANFIYGYFALPESLSIRNRRRFDWKRANPLGSLLQLRKYSVVSGLVFSFVFVYLGSYAVQSVWTYYTMYKFGWDEGTVGISLGVVGALVMFVQGFLIRKIIPKYGQARSVFVGLLLYAFGLALFAFATQGWMMFVFLIPYCLGGIAGPALQGIISGQVRTSEQGELQGGLASIMSVTSIVGPLMMNYLFSFFSGESAPLYFPGMPYLTGSIFMIIAALLAIPTLNHLKNSQASGSPLNHG